MFLRRIDGRLHILGSAVDVFAEVELEVIAEEPAHSMKSFR